MSFTQGKHPLMQKLLGNVGGDYAEEKLRPIVLQPEFVCGLLEEQAAEVLRGQIHDKPRWAE
jgi:hypothetical protein